MNKKLYVIIVALLLIVGVLSFSVVNQSSKNKELGVTNEELLIKVISTLWNLT